MNSTKAKKYKLWYQILMVVGLLGLVDIATHSIVSQNYGLTDIGYVSIGAFFLFKFLFGTQVASTLSMYVSIIFGSSIGWLIIAYFLNQKSKVIENPTEENQKEFKRAKIVSWVLGGIFLALALLGILLVLV